MRLKEKYGQLALVAGASEGIGAAYSEYLAAEGIDLILVARRKEPLEQLASTLISKYNIKADFICCDLADSNATLQLQSDLQNKEINILVYNAAIPYIGLFEENDIKNNNQIAQANMVTPMNLIQVFGKQMLAKGKGAVIIMTSIAGFQGSGFLAAYAATKAFNRILAESLWYEWKDRGVDVIACCAGATATPNFINTKPEKAGLIEPPVQQPAEVVKECFKKLGKQPSIVTGTSNKIISFLMQRLMPRKLAITIMGDTARKMYRL